MTDVINHWLQSGQMAQIESLCLAPVESSFLRGTALCVRRRQAEVFILRNWISDSYILKKFVAGQLPRPEHLRGVSAVLPVHDGLRAGRERQLLGRQSLKFGQYAPYFCPELAGWLENCVLMPQIPGSEWGVLADARRANLMFMVSDLNVHLAINLAQLIDALESSGASHRDLSNANVLVDEPSSSVSLIDFDGLFHHRLPPPGATVAGTAGYVAPFVWNNGNPDARATWCHLADRFALAVLIAEIMTIAPGVPTQGDGGLFSQDELAARRGPGIDWAKAELEARDASLWKLFDAALRSGSFGDCPSPRAWIQALEAVCDERDWRDFEPLDCTPPLSLRQLPLPAVTPPPAAFVPIGLAIRPPPPALVVIPKFKPKFATPSVRLVPPSPAW